MQLSDWKRLLFGKAPPEFLIEVILRSIVMYVVLLLTLRLLGKRMNAQLSITDLAVMISLGAIVSLPMQSPERGLLNGAILLLAILAFQRGLGVLSLKSHRADKFVYGRMCTLVKDGILQTRTMRREGITKDQLFAQLRYRHIAHLGQLDRVYLEANGLFSIFRAGTPKPGLSTLPEKDQACLTPQVPKADVLVCCYCGATTSGNEAEADECANCHHRRQWTQAVI